MLEGLSRVTNFLHEKHQCIVVRKLEYYELSVLYLCILKQPVTSIVYLKEWFATFLAQKPNLMKCFSKLTLEIKLNDTSTCIIENISFMTLGKFIYLMFIFTDCKIDVSILLIF